MFALTGLRFRVAPTQDDLWTIVGRISTALGRPSLLLSMLTAAHSATGVKHEPSLSYLGGSWTRPFDVLFTESACVLILSQGIREFQLWEFRLHSSASALQTLVGAVDGAVLSDGPLNGADVLVKDLKFGVSREERDRRPPEATPIEWKSPEVDSEASKVAGVLANRPIREATIALRRTGRLAMARLPDASSQILVSSGLARQLWQVKCRKDSRALAIVEDVAAFADKTVRCQCGRSYSDEIFERILEPSALAAILEQSKWMLRWLSDRAEKSGVLRSEIGWNAVRGDDELDMAIHLPGLLAFVELKDRDFGLGDLYKFLVRLDRYGGDIGFICVTGRIDDQVVEFATSQSRFPPLVLVAEVDLNPSRFDTALGEIQGMAFARLLNRIGKSRGIAISLDSFVHSWYEKAVARPDETRM